MTVSEKIYALLYTVTHATYPIYAPQGTEPPFIVFDILSTTPNTVKGLPSQVDEVSVRISCFDRSLLAAQKTGISVRSAIDNVTDRANSIDSISFDNEQSDFDEDSQFYYSTQDYTVRQTRHGNYT